MKYKLALIFLIVGLSGAVYAADPVRFDAGVTTVDQNDLLNMFPYPDPTEVFVVFEEFANPIYDTTNAIIGSVATGATASAVPSKGWILSVTNASAVNGDQGPVVKIDNVRSSALRIIPASSDNDAVSFTLGQVYDCPDGDGINTGVRNILAATEAISPFIFESGKKTWFKTRFKLSDPVQCDFRIGLIQAENAQGGNNIRGTSETIQNGVFFDKVDGVSGLGLGISKEIASGFKLYSSTTVASVTTCSANTWTTVGFYYDGVSTVQYGAENANGKFRKVGDAAATYIPSASLTIQFGIVNGEAVTSSALAKDVWIDYIFAAQER